MDNEPREMTVTEKERLSLRAQLTDNFQTLLFHREGYKPCEMLPEVAANIAATIEAKAFIYVNRVAELGLEGPLVKQYAKEAATLLLEEVDKYTIPLAGPRGSSGSSPGVDPQQLSLNEFSGGLRSIHTAPTQQHQQVTRHKEAPWGWLVPGSRMLPYVVLKGAGVALGRGKEALWAVNTNNSNGSSCSPRSLLASGSDRRLTEVLNKNLGFVEIPDGRVSRLHCVIKLCWPTVDGPPVPMLEDCSSNGTFHNGRRMGKSETAILMDGDRISLVKSVAPLSEQYFEFKQGDPRDPELVGSEEQSWLNSAQSTGVYSPTAAHVHSPAVPNGTSSIFRSATSRYTTAEQSTLDDLKCQICLNTLTKCVALDPCGHNFCATCLSHHLGNQLQAGMQLTCPFRCPPPERIIINYAVRALIELLSAGKSPPSRLPSSAGATAAMQAAAQQRQPPLSAAFASEPATALLAAASVSLASPVAASGDSGSSRGTPGAASVTTPASAPSSGNGAAGAGASGSGGAAGTASASGLPPMPSFAGTAAAAAGGAGPASVLATLSQMPGSSDDPQHRLPSMHRQASDVTGTSGSSANGSSTVPAAAGLARLESSEGDFYTQGMSVLCPLDDEHLPMEAGNLKNKQVEVALEQLKDLEASPEVHLVSLESLARLAWSDDGVREAVANSGGVKALVGVMKQHADHDGIQCNGCLSLMSLVRGEGEVCQSNQWHIAKAGAVEVITEAMRRFRDSSMVQLSVLLCFIPLCLDNAMMQAHITKEALLDIVAALDGHPEEVDIQTKGMVLLGVLLQGDDAVHDAIRQRELEVGVPKRVKFALTAFGSINDDVLWAALFVLAVLVRDSSTLHARTTRAIAASSIVGVLKATVHTYTARQDAYSQEPDEMILSASNYLLETLEPVEESLQRHRHQLLALAVAAGVGLALLAGHYYVSNSSNSSSSSSDTSSSSSRSGGSSRGSWWSLK